jgi:hypothetical protein
MAIQRSGGRCQKIITLFSLAHETAQFGSESNDGHIRLWRKSSFFLMAKAERLWLMISKGVMPPLVPVI